MNVLMDNIKQLMVIVDVFVETDYTSIKLPVCSFVLLDIVKMAMEVVSKELLLSVNQLNTCKVLNVFQLVQ